MNQSSPDPTLDDVRRALALPGFDVLSAWMKMAPMPRPLERPADRPGSVRVAGVLLLIYPHAGGLTFALTRRTDTLASHKGQISFPGGAVESGETPAQAALRETREEVGVALEPAHLIGELTAIYVIVSDFEIHPVVGYAPQRPDFRPDSAEVAELLEPPLTLLLDDTIKTRERWNLNGRELDVPFYRMQGHAVWGATAVMLSEFEQRLRAAMAGETRDR